MIPILKKELNHYFKTMIGYVFIGFFLVAFGTLFSLNLFLQNSDYSQVIGSQVLMICVLFFGMPMMTMGLMAEERQSKTEQLIMTAPIKSSDVIMGKYTATVLLFLLALCLTMFQPILLSMIMDMPTAKIILNYVGFTLLGTTLIAMGLLISSLSNNTVIAAIITYITFFCILFSDTLVLALPKDRRSSIMACVLMLGVICGLIYLMFKQVWLSVGLAVAGLMIIIILAVLYPTYFDGRIIHLVKGLSLMSRYNPFKAGIFDLSAVVYYISVTIGILYLNVQIIEGRRWRL